MTTQPIGLSLVRLLAVEPPRLTFVGVDMIDGTSLLDLKPYFREADTPIGDVRCGWYDSVDLGGPVTPRAVGRTLGERHLGRLDELSFRQRLTNIFNC